MKSYFIKSGIFAAFVGSALSGFSATYYVNSIASLTTRINSAMAGDEIVVSNGVYTTSASIGISRAGTAASPILIRAETIGGVEINGTDGFNFNSGAAYVVVQGFKLTHAAAIGISSGANHCRLTRNVIELAIPPGSDVSYVNISGDDIEIDHNELRNKSTLGEMLDITGSGSQVARRLWVHHNYFHDFTSPGGNGAETIRWGLSGLSLSTGNGLCEYNLFVRCRGENEMISNKSSGNTYRYNTVLDCAGGEISQRHGNDCLYYGNYMRNTQGMRIYGDRHKIFSNYFESNSVAVNMGNGDGDVYNGAALTAHDRPDDNVVVFNTFVNNTTHYQMGGRTGGLGSSNTVVANNLFQGGGSIASISSSAPYTGSWSNNIRWQTSSAGNMPASAILAINPLVVKDSSGAYHIKSGSPAINAGVGAKDYYGVISAFSYVTNDMDGQARDVNKDIGADEFSSAPVTARILTTNDVGPLSDLLGQVAAPAFSPRAGNFPAEPISITITTATSGASIRYTINGPSPGSDAGTLYSGPITLTSNATLQVIAYKSGFRDSIITTGKFFIGGPYLFEAEDLPATGFGAATAVQIDANSSAGKWMALLADGVGDFVEYILPNVPAGVYELEMAYKAHPNRGILSLAVDGQTLGAPLDQYADPPAYPVTNFVPLTFLADGSHVLRETVVGLNPAAGAYTLSADKFTLTLLGSVQAPDIVKAFLVDGDLVITGTNGVPGSACYLLSSTNLNSPLSDWLRVATNFVGSDGTLNFTNTFAVAAPFEFFRLKLGF